MRVHETSKTALPFQGLRSAHFKTLPSISAVLSTRGGGGGGAHSDGKTCLPHLQRKHNSCNSRRNSPHPVREALHTVLGRPEESGTRLWPEGLRQACEAKSGLTESDREREVHQESRLHDPQGRHGQHGGQRAGPKQHR